MAKDGLPRDKLLLGLAIGAVAFGLRAAGRPRPERSTMDELKSALRKGLRDAASVMTEKVRHDLAEAQRLSKAIGEGAHDPGAVIFYPKHGEGMTVERYGPGIAGDDRRKVLLYGPLWRGSYGPAEWMLKARRGNYPVLAVLRGLVSRGWRDIGPVPAVTITHSFPDSYFPHRDSLYADQLPLDDFAALLQAAHSAAESRAQRTPLVVIDNREAHRAENERLAALEDPATIRGLHGRKTAADAPGALIWLGEPDASIVYDAPSKKVKDPRTGLTLATREAGDRDFPYVEALIFKDSALLGFVSVHQNKAWRPGYGETVMINIDRGFVPDASGPGRRKMDPAALPLALIAPLLNSHPRMFWGGEHLGKAIVVDTRADPIHFY